jgi:hypothetical protein
VGVARRRRRRRCRRRRSPDSFAFAVARSPCSPIPPAFHFVPLATTNTRAIFLTLGVLEETPSSARACARVRCCRSGERPLPPSSVCPSVGTQLPRTTTWPASSPRSARAWAAGASRRPPVPSPSPCSLRKPPRPTITTSQQLSRRRRRRRRQLTPPPPRLRPRPRLKQQQQDQQQHQRPRQSRRPQRRTRSRRPRRPCRPL